MGCRRVRGAIVEAERINGSHASVLMGHGSWLHLELGRDAEIIASDPQAVPVPTDDELLSWTRTSYDGRDLVEARAHFAARCIEWVIQHPGADLEALVAELRARHE